MKLFPSFIFIFILSSGACTKPQNMPASKTDYIPIISSKSPLNVARDQPVVSTVTMGFYERSADIKFLSFEVRETSVKQFDIRAKGFYDNIQYGISQPVVSIFDTTLTLQTTTSGPGQYLLKFYSFNQPVQTDTVQVN
jgi:hypothetical protein